MANGPKFTQDGGGIVKAAVARRNMRCYAVPENELDQISSLNTQSTIFASIGSFLASLVVAIIMDALMQFGQLKDLEGAVSIFVYIVAPGLGIISIIFFISCWYVI